MVIGVDIKGIKRLRQRAKKVEAEVGRSKQNLARGLHRGMLAVEGEAKTIARSGGVFSARSKGLLARSLRVKTSSQLLISRIISQVVYGPIQEFGGWAGRGLKSFIPPTEYALKSYNKKEKVVLKELAKVGIKMLKF